MMPLLLPIAALLACFLVWLLSKLWRLSRRKDRLLSSRARLRRAVMPERRRRRRRSHRKE